MLLLYARQIAALTTPQQWSTHEVRCKDTSGRHNCKFIHNGTFIYDGCTVHRLVHCTGKCHMLVRNIGEAQKVTVVVSIPNMEYPGRGLIRANYNDFYVNIEVGLWPHEQETIYAGSFTTVLQQKLVAENLGVTPNQKVTQKYIGPDILIRNSSR